MENRNRILVVDDVEMNRAMLADMLAADYETIEAATGRQALDILSRRQDEIALILLDIIMPDMDGFEVLKAMNQSGGMNHIPVIMISAETSSAYIDQAYDLGAVDYISRPFDEKIVQRRVHNTMMLYSKQKMLEDMVAEQIIEKEKNNFLMVEILSNIVEFRNGESGLHVLNIRVLTEIFLTKLQEITSQYPMTAEHMALIVNASALHDIGKISIPEEILNKPGKLTEEEFAVIKTHGALGAQIIKGAVQQRHREKLLSLACNICLWHHERYDGGGYPDGLKGEQIPIEAQVVSLADVYDALTSVRVYKPAFSYQTAIEMILNGECGAFNPLLLQCLREVGPCLEERLKHHSLNMSSDFNIQAPSSQMLTKNQISGRTLTLLEQERIKYQFFASMSNEIQFEYSYKTNVLTMSDWGARQLELPVLIESPEHSAVLHKVFPLEDYLDMRRRLHSVTPENPIVSATYRLCIKGEKRWYKATARPLWEGEEADGIVGVIGKFVDIHEEQLRLNQWKKRAQQDSLTGLSNHSSVKSVIYEMLRQTKKKFALVLFDLDNFKEANDLHGHLFGDQVLKYVARKIQESVRDGDLAARVGGDEFLLFIEYKGNIEMIVERIFQAICGKYQTFEVSVSMGVSLSPENAVDYEELFHMADQALYAAKSKGKDRYIFYNESMKELLSVLSPMDH